MNSNPGGIWGQWIPDHLHRGSILSFGNKGDNFSKREQCASRKSVRVQQTLALQVGQGRNTVWHQSWRYLNRVLMHHFRHRTQEPSVSAVLTMRRSGQFSVLEGGGIVDSMEEGPRALKAVPKRNLRTRIVEHSVTHGDRCPVNNEQVHLAPRELWTLYHCGVWEHVGGRNFTSISMFDFLSSLAQKVIQS